MSSKINVFLIMYLKLYLKITKLIMNILPLFIYHTTYIIQSSEDLNYSIIEKTCNFKNKFYNVKFINDNKKNYDIYIKEFSKNILKKINSRMMLNYSCIYNTDKHLFIDISNDIKSFSHYFDQHSIYNLENTFYFKYILDFIIIKYNLNNNSFKIDIHFNDTSLTTKTIII
jgi:hypothetical protein